MEEGPTRVDGVGKKERKGTGRTGRRQQGKRRHKAVSAKKFIEEATAVILPLLNASATTMSAGVSATSPENPEGAEPPDVANATRDLPESQTPLLFPTLQNRENGMAPFATAPEHTALPWRYCGVAFFQVTVDENLRLHCASFSPPSSQEFLYGENVATCAKTSVRLPEGASAVVLCAGEPYFRALSAPPARIGEAAGHAGLAAEQPVLFAGEIVVGPDNQLTAWTSVSGTYQIPDAYVHQSKLPAAMFWRFVCASDLHLYAHRTVQLLRGGHALIQPNELDDDMGRQPNALLAEASELAKNDMDFTLDEYASFGSACIGHADVVAATRILHDFGKSMASLLSDRGICKVSLIADDSNNALLFEESCPFTAFSEADWALKFSNHLIHNPELSVTGNTKVEVVIRDETHRVLADHGISGTLSLKMADASSRVNGSSFNDAFEDAFCGILKCSKSTVALSDTGCSLTLTRFATGPEDVDPVELDSLLRGASAGREIAYLLGVPLALCLRLPGVAFRIRQSGHAEPKIEPGQIEKFIPPGKVRQARFIRTYFKCAAKRLWNHLFEKDYCEDKSRTAALKALIAEKKEKKLGWLEKQMLKWDWFCKAFVTGQPLEQCRLVRQAQDLEFLLITYFTGPSVLPLPNVLVPAGQDASDHPWRFFWTHHKSHKLIFGRLADPSKAGEFEARRRDILCAHYGEEAWAVSKMVARAQFLLSRTTLIEAKLIAVEIDDEKDSADIVRTDGCGKISLEWLHDHVGRNVVAVQALIGGVKGVFSGCKDVLYGSIQVRKKTQIKLSHLDIQYLEVLMLSGLRPQFLRSSALSLRLRFSSLSHPEISTIPTICWNEN